MSFAMKAQAPKARAQVVIRAQAVSARDVRVSAASDGAITKAKLDKMNKAGLVEILKEKGLPSHDRLKADMVGDIWALEAPEEENVRVVNQTAQTRKAPVVTKQAVVTKTPTKKAPKVKEQPVGTVLREDFAAAAFQTEIQRLKARVAELTEELEAAVSDLATAEAVGEEDRIELERVNAELSALKAEWVNNLSSIRSSVSVISDNNKAEVEKLQAEQVVLQSRVHELEAEQAAEKSESAEASAERRIFSMALPGLAAIRGAQVIGSGAMTAYYVVRNSLVQGAPERQTVDAVALSALAIGTVVALQ